MSFTKIQQSVITSLFMVLAVTLTPTFTYAHTGVGPVHDVLHGFAHPLTGLDHLLAMFAVGLWAAQRGGRALWCFPLTFVAIMSLGGALGMAGVQLPYIEPAIAVSVIAAGLLVAANIRPPFVLSAAVVSVFALFHGHAHGTEIPPAAAGMTYAFGFIIATILIQISGIAGGLATRRAYIPQLVRCAGAAIALSGACLL